MTNLTKHNAAAVAGSLSQIAADSNKSLAETFINADCIVLCDISSSMNTRDARGKQSRYEVLCEELTTLQRSMPGKIAVIGFSTGKPMFCPTGTLPSAMGGTDVRGALEFAKIADVPGAMRFVLISDGEMDDEHGAISMAAGYRNKIDVIYVGPEAQPYGRDALQRLAQASGGQAITADRVSGLALGVRKLLTAA